ncbi:phage holin family protein [Arcanobacterium haemolyticum]|nr:phage holin family protein [Arcanobacterium haemolyticum]
MENDATSAVRSDASAPRSERTIGELIAKVSEQLSSLIRDEIEFATVNLKAKLTNIGVGGALIAVGGVLAVFAFTLCLFGAVAAFALIMPWWGAFLTVAGILLALTLILVLIGLLQIKASKKHVVDPKGGLEKDVEAIKKGLDK